MVATANTESTATLAERLEMLSQIRARKESIMAEIAPALEALAADEANLRAEIEAAMERSNSLRTESAGGLYGLIAITKKPVVVDPQAAMAWLENRGELKRYMKLDADLLLKEHGKDSATDPIPGLRIDEWRSFQIRTSK